MLAFIDESGYPIKNDESPFYVLVAACFYEWDIAKLDRRIYQAKENYRMKKYPLASDSCEEEEKHDIEIKAKTFITKRRFRLSYDREFITEVFEALKLSRAKIIRVVGERPDADFSFAKNRLKPHYTLLVKALEKAAREQNADPEKPPINFISAVFDNIHHKETLQVTKQFANLIHKAEYKGKNYSHITAWPLFVDSGVVGGIQIADLAAGIIRHQYCIKRGENLISNFKEKYPDDFCHWIDNKYEIVKSKFWLERDKYVLLKKDALISC